jgi:hypothetical protein
VLLELVVRRAQTSVELCQWTAGWEKAARAFLLADEALWGKMEGREETPATCLGLDWSGQGVGRQGRAGAGRMGMNRPIWESRRGRGRYYFY